MKNIISWFAADLQMSVRPLLHKVSNVFPACDKHWAECSLPYSVMHRQWGVIWSYMIHCRLLSTPLPSKPISWPVCIFISLPPLMLSVCHSCFYSSTCALFLFHPLLCLIFCFYFSFHLSFPSCFILPLLYPSFRSLQFVWDWQWCVCLTQWNHLGLLVHRKSKIFFILSESKVIKCGFLWGWTMTFGCEQRRGVAVKYCLHKEGPLKIFGLEKQSLFVIKSSKAKTCRNTRLLWRCCASQSTLTLSQLTWIGGIIEIVWCCSDSLWTNDRTSTVGAAVQFKGQNGARETFVVIRVIEWCLF